MNISIRDNNLLELLGCDSNDARVVQFLVENRIHDRPKTVEMLRDAEAIEDDGDNDVEYELIQEAKSSLVVESERLGLCLIFEAKQSDDLVNNIVTTAGSKFIVKEVCFFRQGVEIYQEYAGDLPFGISFNMKQHDAAYTALGTLVASRVVEEVPADLFVIDGKVLNVGFDGSADPSPIFVRVRNAHWFDRQMLKPVTGFAAGALVPPDVFASMCAQAIGQKVNSAEVIELFADLGVRESDLYEGVCPDEITRLAVPKGITLYFNDVTFTPPSGVQSAPEQRLSSITFKRRGDLGSKGFAGSLPFQMEFGDTPETLIARARRQPESTHSSGQLLSYYWQTDTGCIIQAVCSLIDWQLYRVSLHAAYLADQFDL